MIHRPAGRRSQRGIALIAVLWGVALLSVLATAFIADTRTQSTLTRNLAENAKAEALADAGVYRAIDRLLTFDLAAAWRADGTVYRLQLGEGTVAVTAVDESGKIDLNRSPDQVLAGLFRNHGLDDGSAKALIDAIRDFTDRDGERRPAGAEDDDYHAAGRPWGAKDAPFESVAELQQVLGMPGALYERVARYLTVHAARAQVNPATAPRAVLLAIPGLAEDQVDALLARRNVPGQQVRSIGAAFTIRSEAGTQGGGVFVREAVVQRGADRRTPYRIREWRRVWDSDAAAASDGD
ncbi:MAG: general secretion pathway protein GspK [Inquilinus sp.]|nr:general secretion pathway protein GspK [Inquilinus sp.]